MSGEKTESGNTPFWKKPDITREELNDEKNTCEEIIQDLKISLEKDEKNLEELIDQSKGRFGDSVSATMGQSAKDRLEKKIAHQKLLLEQQNAKLTGINLALVKKVKSDEKK